jgi:hypothetical protein
MLLFPPPAAVAALFFLPTLASASWDCNAVSDKIRWDFSALKGKHEVVVSNKQNPWLITNTTWQINPCGPIGKTKEKAKVQCPAGTQGKILSSQPLSLFLSTVSMYGADTAQSVGCNT